MTDQPRWPAGTPVNPTGKGPGGGRFRDDDAPGAAVGGWAAAAAGQAIGGWRPISRGELSLLVRNNTPIKRTKATGGQVASTQILDYGGGRFAVHKAHGQYDGPDSVAGEYLSALVGHAIGAPVPAVIIDPDSPDTAIYMQYAPSDLTRAGLPARLTPEPMASDDALLLGLLDVLVYNWDRNSSNWKIAPGGRMVGLDHGMALREFNVRKPDGTVAAPALGLQMGARPGRRFVRVTPLGPQWIDNDLHPDDIPVIRQRLQALLPQFTDHHKQYYHQEMLERLDTLALHATGTRRVIT